MITAERLRDLLDYDPETGLLTWKVRRPGWREGRGCVNNYGYPVIRVDGTTYLVHRLVWLHTHGTWPPNHIDHVNGVRHDNRMRNLRLATHSENLQNRRGPRRDGTSGALGVSWDAKRQKWASYLGVNGKRVHTGRHDTIDAAIAARRAAEIKHHPFSPRIPEIVPQ
jgi:hypothetical protein